jgi:acetoin utilization protein AcuB
MLVQDIMTRTVSTVRPATTLAEALRVARTRGVRHLPVLDDDGRLVGIVSDRDLKRAMATSSYEDVRMGAIMTSATVHTAAPTFSVEEAARIMVAERISALPVTTDGRLVGIVTETDILALFVRALGAAEPSSRLDVDLGSARSALAEVVGILESCGTPISSVVTLVNPEGRREGIIRVATIDPGSAIRALEARGYHVRDAQRVRA